MNGLGLSAAALAERKKYICAGDAALIMAGEAAAVWAQKTGRATEADLSNILAVQMGSYTEPFNLAWYMKVTGRPVRYFSENPLMRHIWHELTGLDAEARELVVSQDYPWMACNLDALSVTPQGHECVLDAKHVGRADEQAILRYTAAGTHQATVCGTDWWGLSFFVGNGKFEVVYQEVDPLYQAELIGREREVWGYISRDEQPPGACDVCEGTGKTRHVIYAFDGDSDRQIPEREEIGPCEECGGTGRLGPAPVLPPKPAPRLRQVIVPTDNPDMLDVLVRQNNWLPDALKEARRLIETDGAAKVNAIARKELAGLIPEDVGLLSWGRYKGARDKAGTLRMTVKPLEETDG